MADSLGGDAVRLALMLIAAPQPVLSAAAYRALPGSAELRASGLLVKDGYEPVATRRSDNEEEPVILHRDDGQYQRYSDVGRPIIVDPDALDRWRLDMRAFIEAVMEDWPEGTSGDPPEPVPSAVWDLGVVPVRNRHRAVSIWLAPRAGESRIWVAIREALIASPMNGVRVLLTATDVGDRMTFRPAFVVPMAFPQVAQKASLAVDLSVVAMRLDQRSSWSERQPVTIVGDGEEVWLYDDVFHFPRAVEQRRVIVALNEHLLRGKQTVSSALLLDGLGFKEGTRLRNMFKDSPAWGKLLDEVSGVVGFCL